MTTYANGISLHTTSFSTETSMPVQYTCDGKDISPQIDWTHIPDKTVSLALIMSDPDAPGGTFYHWVLYNIPKTVTQFPEAMRQLPADTLAGKNSWGKMQYNGPCPPKGATHHYVFTLYALDKKLTLPTATAETILNAIQNHILDQGELTTVYKR